MDTSALSSICNGFVYREDRPDGTCRYVKNDHCLDNLKDLQRFLRRDDPEARGVFKQVCKWNVVGRDLVPLLESFQSERNLVTNVVKILVFLTMPVDPTSDDIIQQVDYLWQLKGVLSRGMTIAIIVSLLEDPLEHLESAAFTEDDWKLVQLVLTLFRNLLAVRDVMSWQNTSGYSTHYLQSREYLLEIMFKESVMDLILILIQHINDANGYLHQESLLFLEIVHFIFNGYDPELLAKSSKENAEVIEGLVSNEDSLRTIMDEEQEKLRLCRSGNLEHCTNFGGIFTSQTIDGNRIVVKGNPLSIANFLAFEKEEKKAAVKSSLPSTSNNYLIKARQVQRGPLKRIARDTRSLPLPKENVTKMLCSFLNNFLSGSCNDLMQSVLEDIQKENDTFQSADIQTFFQVACFIIAFQHHKIIDIKLQTPSSASVHEENAGLNMDICSPIATTLSERMLFLVISKWREAFDSLKQTHDFKTLFAAASLMKNIIRMLDLLLKVLPEYSRESKTARVLLYKLFYDQTAEGFCQFLLSQIKSFDTQRQTKSYLADLLEIFHVILRLMENLQQHGALRVSKKSKKRRKKKSCSIPEAENITGPVPSLGDNDVGGKNVVSNAEIGVEWNQSVEDHDGNDSMVETNAKTTNHDPEYGTDGTSNDDDCQKATNEVDFNVSKLVSECATSSAIQNVCWLLKYCRSNSPCTNHHIVCLLRRICKDLELSPLLYQLSFLVIFYDILSDDKISKRCPDVAYFLTKLVRNMMKKLKNQPLLFVDILFQKTRKECHIINSEGIEHELSHMKKEMEGLCGGDIGERCLTGEFGCSTHKNLAEALGEDEFHLKLGNGMEDPHMKELQSHMDETTSIKNSRNSLSTMNGNFGSADPNIKNIPGSELHLKEATHGKKLVLTHEHEIVIRSLFEKFKDQRRCNYLIAEALDSQGKVSPLQVSRKLKQLGLKVSRRKNSRSCSLFPSEETQTDDNKLAGEVILYSSNKSEDSSHLGSQKRRPTNPFSQDEETLIKELFEQFKDSRKCSRMIADSLDSNNKYTVAQVSRKLKQLGLLSRGKRASNDRKSSVLEVSSEKENSEEETLITMIRREKSKRRKISDKKSINGDINLPLNGNQSDNEPLTSLLKVKSKRKNFSDKRSPVSDKKSPSDYNDLPSGANKYSNDHPTALLIDPIHLPMDDRPEVPEATAEPTLLDDFEEAVTKEIEGPTALMLDKGDELADSEDDMGAIKTLGMRRKLMLTVELDDE